MLSLSKSALYIIVETIERLKMKKIVKIAIVAMCFSGICLVAAHDVATKHKIFVAKGKINNGGERSGNAVNLYAEKVDENKIRLVISKGSSYDYDKTICHVNEIYKSSEKSGSGSGNAGSVLGQALNACLYSGSASGETDTINITLDDRLPEENTTMCVVCTMTHTANGRDIIEKRNFFFANKHIEK